MIQGTRLTEGESPLKYTDSYLALGQRAYRFAGSVTKVLQLAARKPAYKEQGHGG